MSDDRFASPPIGPGQKSAQEQRADHASDAQCPGVTELEEPYSKHSPNDGSECTKYYEK